MHITTEKESLMHQDEDNRYKDDDDLIKPYEIALLIIPLFFLLIYLYIGEAFKKLKEGFLKAKI